MVRAGSINRFTLRDRYFKFIIAGIALLVVLVLGFGLFLVFNGGKRDGSITPATSTSLPDDVAESLLAVKFPVSQPEKIPTNFVRTDVQIISASRSKSKCDEVLQNYQGSNDPDVAYIDIYSYAVECVFPRPDDAEAFIIGDYQGWISDPDATAETADDGQSVLIELTVNSALVRVETDLSRDQISPVLAKFLAFSLTPPEATLEIPTS